MKYLPNPIKFGKNVTEKEILPSPNCSIRHGMQPRIRKVEITKRN
jgi:hypothetical protein